MGVPKLSEIDAPGKPEEMYRDENGAICYNQQREVHQWAEREYRLNSLAASFQQKLTHNPKLNYFTLKLNLDCLYKFTPQIRHVWQI